LGLALLNRDGPGPGDLTASRQVMGTADYMAPEQWESSHGVDIRADLYSLGCTLYFLLAGKPPFGGPEHGSNARKMAAHLRDAVPPIRGIRADVPEELAAVLDRLLAKAPAPPYATPQAAAPLGPARGGGAGARTVCPRRRPGGGGPAHRRPAGARRQRTDAGNGRKRRPAAGRGPHHFGATDPPPNSPPTPDRPGRRRARP